jgi:hypothetical protein
LYNLFYINKVKVIPDDIYNLLDPVALAHWICGDGYSLSKGLALCTDSFSIKDTVKLSNVLIIRYNFKCTLHKNKENSYRIFISRKSMNSLIQIVKPHMAPSMFYKLGII